VDDEAIPGCLGAGDPSWIRMFPVYDHEAGEFETGHVFENNLTVSGGNEMTVFYLSLGQLHTGRIHCREFRLHKIFNPS